MAEERLEFQAEVSRLLDIVARSLYSKKDVFLRELISNASDACDRLRYAALTTPDLLSDDAAFQIRLSIDKDAGTLAIADNGIGMDRTDLIENLGTIAKSGTGAFLEQMQGDATEDLALIGQFGVGFYSAFMLADLYRPALEEKNLTLDIRIDGGGLQVAGLESRLVQVFRNLIGNAISFSPDGGTITLAARPIRLRGRLLVEMEVLDEGPGIQPGKEEAVFDRFYTERPSTEKFGTHSGLGLSISKQITEAHKGEIFVRNRSERSGASFTVRIPAL